MQWKISLHSIAAEMRNGPLINTTDFGMMPFKDQADKRSRFHTANASTKWKWSSKISRIHSRRPPSLLSGGHPTLEDAQPDTLQQALNRPGLNPALAAQSQQQTRSLLRPILMRAMGRSSDLAATERGREASGYDLQQGEVMDNHC